jgi:hypothetical protein
MEEIINILGITPHTMGALSGLTLKTLNDKLNSICHSKGFLEVLRYDTYHD